MLGQDGGVRGWYPVRLSSITKLPLLGILPFIVIAGSLSFRLPLSTVRSTGVELTTVSQPTQILILFSLFSLSLSSSFSFSFRCRVKRSGAYTFNPDWLRGAPSVPLTRPKLPAEA